MLSRNPEFFPITISLAVVAVLTTGHSGFCQDKTLLKGNVREQGQYTGGNSGGPSLNRKDLEQSGDPFGSRGQPGSVEEEQALEAPGEAFQAVSMPPRSDSPDNKFGLGAEMGDPGLTSMNGRPDALSSMPSQMPEASPNLQSGNPMTQTDPDAHMTLEWEAWHRRVAEAIFQRWKPFVDVAFKDSHPRLARVDYLVTRDGQIQDVKLMVKSNNPMYDALIVQVVKSFNGERAILQFPAGSRRGSIEKFGDFSQNQHTGMGYRYTTGDRETIRRR
jgi:hypothetical protein